MSRRMGPGIASVWSPLCFRTPVKKLPTTKLPTTKLPTTSATMPGPWPIARKKTPYFGLFEKQPTIIMQKTPVTKPPATAMMPPPATVAQQKAQYLGLLDNQLKSTTAALGRQMQCKMHQLRTQANHMKAQFATRVDLEVKKSEMTHSQQYQREIFHLQAIPTREVAVGGASDTSLL
eukprot:GEMP01065455.1.p1 GENE.GEMP01065455.1~~GEMP01065455.1.p1  ORF type:complete len:177 (+),score=45.51 GEMP01065455.1:79-609(+)